jgi:hypothetical protein
MADQTGPVLDDSVQYELEGFERGQGGMLHHPNNLAVKSG